MPILTKDAVHECQTNGKQRLCSKKWLTKRLFIRILRYTEMLLFLSFFLWNAVSLSEAWVVNCDGYRFGDAWCRKPFLPPQSWAVRWEGLDKGTPVSSVPSHSLYTGMAQASPLSPFLLKPRIHREPLIYSSSPSVCSSIGICVSFRAEQMLDQVLRHLCRCGPSKLASSWTTRLLLFGRRAGKELREDLFLALFLSNTAENFLLS